MIKKFIALSLSLIMVVTLFSGCSLFKNAEFHIGFIDEIESLDPLKATGDAETMSAANCFEGLLKFNQNGEIVLSGATKYSISICVHSRSRKIKSRGLISLRKAFPCWARPKGMSG